MSVAVCRGPAVPAFEAPRWLRPVEPYKPPEVAAVDVDDRPAQVDIWNAIQADVGKAAATAGGAKKAPSKPYVHPLVRRSSCLMSQKSLEVCTESLGNETGSGDFTSSLDMAGLFVDSPLPPPAAAADDSFWQQQQHDADRCDCEEEQQQQQQWERESKDLAAVNYHCSSGARSPPRRSFPPPLPSMSRRDGPCLQMRARRQDGRLVVEAVAVRPRGYLHARRQGGRLRLSFVECFARNQTAASKVAAAAAAEAPYFRTVVEPRNVREEEAPVEMVEDDVDGGEVLEEEDEEEEVEVLDRGTVVEVKVSTHSPPQAPTAAKVHRSTLVINKFVGGTPVSGDQPRCDRDADTAQPEANTCDETAAAAAAQSPRPTLRRVPSSTTTLAAAVAAASTGTDDVPPAPEEEEGDDDDDDDECGGLHLPPASAAAAEPTKQLLLSFTSRRGDKQDLLQSVRRCRQLRQKKLFILEPYCIATS